MSQATRALVERLKKETTHLPSNVPLHNVALETIVEILDQLVEPEEVADEPEEAEDGGTPILAEEEVLVDEAPAGEAEAPAADDGSGPMTTGNAPT